MSKFKIESVEFERDNLIVTVLYRKELYGYKMKVAETTGICHLVEKLPVSTTKPKKGRWGRQPIKNIKGMSNNTIVRKTLLALMDFWQFEQLGLAHEKPCVRLIYETYYRNPENFRIRYSTDKRLTGSLRPLER